MYKSDSIFNQQSSSNFRGQTSSSKEMTCSNSHKLIYRECYNTGFCDGKDCSKCWSNGALVQVMECKICNEWYCTECYNAKPSIKKQPKLKKKIKQKTDCENLEFSPFMIIATFIYFNKWFEDNNIPYDENEWSLAHNVPDQIKKYFNNYINHAPLIEKLNSQHKLNVSVDKNMEKIQSDIAASGSNLKVDTEALQKIDSPNNVGAFVSLNILEEYWPNNIDMKKMYINGLEILTLNAENTFVIMGDDQFGNIFVKYFVPNTDYSVIITYLKNSDEAIEWLTLLDAYRNLNLTENSQYKGVRFLPVSSKINNCMDYIIDSHTSKFNCIGAQANGIFAVTSKSILSLSIDALTIGSLRGCGEKRKNIDGYIDFYDEDMEFNCFYNVYMNDKLLYSTILTRANYTTK